MVEADAGDDGNERVENIGRVEASAHAGFGNGDMYALLFPPEHAERGDSFEKGRHIARQPFDALPGGFDGVEQRFERLRRHFAAVDAKALREPHQMGRRVESDVRENLPEHCCEHVRNASFPVGAGDVNDAEGFLRIVQLSQEGARGFEPGLHAEGAARIQTLKACSQSSVCGGWGGSLGGRSTHGTG